jgi:predicted NBD/HSP70 family sugar kinase
MPPDLPANPTSLVAWPSLHPTTQAAYNQILWNGGMAKAEVARRLGVSRTRMTVVGRELEVAGMITQGPRQERSTVGRPGDILIAAPDRFHFLGIHVRGTQLVAAVIDLENRGVWEATASLQELSAAVLVEQCQRWLSEVRSKGYRVAAVAVCGSFQQLANAPTGVGLRTVIGEDDRIQLSEQIGGPVWLEDDMVALTAFEQWPRLADGQDSMALVAVGSEIGFGIVADRRIIVGAHRTAGRFSHVPIVPNGPLCPLGHRGCLWSVASVTSILAQVSGARSIEEVAQRAEFDSTASTVLASAAHGLGAAVGYLVNLVDPDKVVLAGDARVVLEGREAEFRAGLSEVALAAEPLIELTEFGFVEWARAAAALGLYRTLGGDRI